MVQLKANIGDSRNNRLCEASVMCLQTKVISMMRKKTRRISVRKM